MVLTAKPIYPSPPQNPFFWNYDTESYFCFGSLHWIYTIQHTLIHLHIVTSIVLSSDEVEVGTDQRLFIDARHLVAELDQAVHLGLEFAAGEGADADCS